MRFSLEVLQLRESLNLSQMAFAKELGVSFTSVNRWENEMQKPSSLALKMLRAYCHEQGTALECTDQVETTEFRNKKQ